MLHKCYATYYINGIYIGVYIYTCYITYYIRCYCFDACNLQTQLPPLSQPTPLVLTAKPLPKLTPLVLCPSQLRTLLKPLQHASNTAHRWVKGRELLSVKEGVANFSGGKSLVLPAEMSPGRVSGCRQGHRNRLSSAAGQNNFYTGVFRHNRGTIERLPLIPRYDRVRL